MFFYTLVENSQLYFLIFARVFALISIAPLLSSTAFPGVIRITLALFTAIAVFPEVQSAGYPIPDTGLAYVFLVIGEIGIGLLSGFFLQLIFTSFLVAGQFFSMQMGFGASVVFDPLAQIQIPIMGQMLNNFAMFVFLAAGGFYKVFLTGVYRSFQSLNAYTLMTQKEHLFTMSLTGLGKLFEHALIIAMPILGTLFLISVSTGLLAKAAPQMNLLMMGFPIAILTAYVIIFLSLPFLIGKFSVIIDNSFTEVLRWYSLYRGAG